MAVFAQELRCDARLVPVLATSNANVADRFPTDMSEGFEAIWIGARPATRSVRALFRSDEPLSLRAVRIVHVGLDRLWHAMGKAMLAGIERISVECANLIEMVVETRRARAWGLRVLLEDDYAAVVVPADRVVGAELGIIDAAKRLSLPVAVISHGVVNAEAVVLRRKHDPLYDIDRKPWRAIKQFMARLHPAQVKTLPEGKRIGYYLPEEYVALRWTGTLPAMPWMIGGGPSDLVFVIGEADRQRFVEDGVPSRKVIPAGGPQVDRLWRKAQRRRQLRADLAQKYGLDQDAAWAIYSLRPRVPILNASLEKNREDVRSVVEDILHSGAKVLVSLHPRGRRSDYEDVLADLEVPILEEPLVDALPGADLFVTYLSSTVRWSLLLGMPTVVSDHYGFNYTLYDEIDGLNIVRKREALRPTLQRLVGDPAARRAIGKRLLRQAERIATFDGKGTSRIVDAILERADAEEAASTADARGRCQAR